MKNYLKKPKFQKQTVGIAKHSRLLFFSLSILIVMQVFSAIRTSNLGAILISIEKEEESLLKENKQLTSEIISVTSLMKIDEMSKYLGFRKPISSLYIDIDYFAAKTN